VKCKNPNCPNEAIIGITATDTHETVWMCQAELYAYVVHAKQVLETFAEAVLVQEVNKIIGRN